MRRSAPANGAELWLKLEYRNPTGSMKDRMAPATTGANVVGAHRLAERLGPEAIIVTLAVDTGLKYMTVAPYLDA